MCDEHAAAPGDADYMVIMKAKHVGVGLRALSDRAVVEARRDIVGTIAIPLRH